MGRPLLSLWRWLLAFVLPVPALAAFAVLDPVLAALLLFILAVVVSGQSRSRVIWRLIVAVRRFRTRTGPRVKLHYDPAVYWWYGLPALIRQSEEDLDRLAAWFGPPLRRPTVFLFADCADVARVFGPGYGGTALAEVNAIVVGARQGLQESIRHELVHLFAARWNRQAPPLLAEGLAVWLQGTEQGEPIDLMAWPWVTEPGLSLRKLLDPGFFFAEPHRWACYLLAGSFTGSLLRHHGKAAYRRLYARATARDLDREFRRCLGLSFEQAERRWRHEVLAGGPLGRPAGPAESPWATAGGDR